MGKVKTTMATAEMVTEYGQLLNAADVKALARVAAIIKEADNLAASVPGYDSHGFPLGSRMQNFFGLGSDYKADRKVQAIRLARQEEYRTH